MKANIMNNKNKTPEVRFSGFTDEWEEKRLRELASIIKGKQIDKTELSIKKTQKNSFPVYNGGKTPSGYINKYNRNNSIMISEGGASAGFVNYYPNKYWSGSHNYTIYEKNINKTFIIFVLEYNQRKIYTLKIGSGIPNIQLKTIDNFVLSISTDISEQQKIGDFFKNLDHLIDLQQKKITYLKELKQGNLQKMFPQKNSKVPEIRFSGFTDEWEEKKLGVTCQIVMGQSPNSNNYTKNPNDNILVQGNADMKNGRVRPRVWTTQITKKAAKGDLILSVRAPVGDIGITDYDVVLGRGVASIKGNQFILQLLSYMNEISYWAKLSTGSTFESINSKDIKNAEINIPSIQEQQKIGNFFKNLDDLINLNQDKLDKLKDSKKGFLQKMFC